MEHTEIKEDLSLFVLGALDPSENRELEAHLRAGCSECEEELNVWRDVVALLALAEDEAASPDLKARLLDRVERRPPRRSWSRAVGLALPLAAGLALVIAGVVHESRLRSDIAAERQRAVGLATELDQSRQAAASLREQVAQRAREIEQLTQQLAAKESDLSQLRVSLAQAERALAILQTPGLRLVRLRETPEAPPAEAHVLLSSERGRAVFYAFDLPPVAAGKTYELWWITEKQGPINAGLFVPDERGFSRLESDVPADAGAIQAAAVTIEPAAGVAKPTGPMVLLGKAAAS